MNEKSGTDVREKSTGDQEITACQASPQLEELSRQFQECRALLQALGDENRQHLILQMLRLNQCRGVRVTEVVGVSNLSRPAVSHHLQILKNAGLVSVRKEGTRNYYYFDDTKQKLRDLVSMLQSALDLIEDLPDRSERF